MNRDVCEPHITVQRRGALAAFFFLLVLSFATGRALASNDNQPALAPVQTQFSDGLTLVARRATASPTAALEIWVRCPANGYDSPRPGIARLAALAVIEAKIQGSSLRDEVRKSGAQISISVYQESTEIAILVPAYLSSSLLDKLTAQALRPHLDQAAFDAARNRLAAQQAASGAIVDMVLRDSLFAHMFSSGPMHDSTYGDPQTLRSLTLSELTAFVSRAYVPASEIVVAVGSVNQDDVVKRVGAAAPPAAAAQRMPESALGALSDVAIPLARAISTEGGLAMGWPGPPIQDERAATAMDFLSDYLTHPADGVLTRAVSALDAATNFNGQFITLRNPGVFFLTASGERLDPAITSAMISDALKGTLHKPLSQRDFEQARDAFVTHLLSDMQTAQGLADNYGWYFVQGALPYSPSATNASLAGQYFERVSSLTPDYVYSIAKRYLSAKPVIIVLPGRAHVLGTPS